MNTDTGDVEYFPPSVTWEDLHRRYYRWWTMSVWWNRKDRGVKIGPLSISVYEWTRGEWHCEAFWWGWYRLFTVPPIKAA